MRCASDRVNNSSSVWEHSNQSPCSAWERVHLQEQHERISFLNMYKYNIAHRNARATLRICLLESRAVTRALEFDVALEGNKLQCHYTLLKIPWENYIVQIWKLLYTKSIIIFKKNYTKEISYIRIKSVPL